jgi:hypothetical protein
MTKVNIKMTRVTTNITRVNNTKMFYGIYKHVLG